MTKSEVVSPVTTTSTYAYMQPRIVASSVAGSLHRLEGTESSDITLSSVSSKVSDTIIQCSAKGNARSTWVYAVLVFGAKLIMARENQRPQPIFAHGVGAVAERSHETNQTIRSTIL